MTVNNFIPTVWASQVFMDFQKATILGGIVNHDYEGDISGQGDTVKITVEGDELALVSEPKPEILPA